MAGIDKEEVRRRFGRSLETYNAAAEVQCNMAHTLCDLLTLATGERQFAEITELGCGSGILTNLIAERFDYAHLTLIDLVPECEKFHRGRPGATFLAGDIEQLELPEADLVLSNAVFQWAVDPDALFRRIAQKLHDGGILAFASFGPQTLRETAQLTGRGLAYDTASRIAERVEAAGLEVLASHEEKIVLEFGSPREVLRHLKSTGVTAVSRTAPWSRRTLETFTESYNREFRLENGNVPLTYHPITLIARKKAMP